MKAIYKIVGDFTDEDFQKILDKTTDKFLIMYQNETLFVSLKNFNDENISEALIKQIFKPAKKYYISEINESNLKKQPYTIQEWCYNNFVRLEKQKYEYNKQDTLRQTWINLDKLEEELKNKQQKEGEKIIGKSN